MWSKVRYTRFSQSELDLVAEISEQQFGVLAARVAVAVAIAEAGDRGVGIERSIDAAGKLACARMKP